MKNNILEFVAAVVLAALAIVVLNPMHAWMPDMTLMLLQVSILAVFCFFAVFVMRETAADEREALHRALAGRIAFLTGSAVLVVGILSEGMTHVVDPWLVLALVLMIFGKIAARIYGNFRL